MARKAYTSEDPAISYRAFGLIVFLWTTHQSLSAEVLSQFATEGRDEVQKAMGELRKMGLIVTSRQRTVNGRWMTGNYFTQGTADLMEKYGIRQQSAMNYKAIMKM